MPRYCRIFWGLINLCFAIGPALIGATAWATENPDGSSIWSDTQDVLIFQRPPAPQITFPWLEQIRGVMIRSFQSADQGRDLINLHNSLGTKAQTNYAKYVGPIKSPVNPQSGVEVRKAVITSIRLYAQKETKVNVFPQSLKDGLRFNVGGQGPSAGPQKGYVYNGNPEMRYGLRLRSIEPSRESMKLASVGLDDYELLRYAPKASAVYEIGEVYPDSGARSYPVSAPSLPEPPPKLSWSQLMGHVPDFNFSGRMAPRGLPGPGSPLPPQSLFLDQSQGYYQLEAQLSGTLKQEAVVHRLRVPVYGKMNYRQERNKDLQYTKTTFENIYSNDQGFAVHLERYHLERRYQLGFQLHRGTLQNLELLAHVPDTALEKDQFWNQHRWETRFDFRF